MPLTHKIDSSKRLVTITGAYASATEWLMFLGQLRRDPAVPPHPNLLRDLRGADRPPNQAMASAIFNVVQRFWPELRVRKWAVLTDDAEDVVPRMMQSLGEQHGLAIRMFTSYIDAIAWLQEP
jgi:hypothetical protein